MSWWLTIDTGWSRYAWDLGEAGDPQQLDDQVIRACVAAQVPSGRADAASLHRGDPHPSLLATCTVRDRAELAAVDAAALSAYRAQRDQATRQARMDAAKAAMAGLTPEERDQVIREIPPRPTGGTR